MQKTRKAIPRNRSAQDATLINIRAIKKRLAKLEAAVANLDGSVSNILAILGMLYKRGAPEVNSRDIA